MKKNDFAKLDELLRDARKILPDELEGQPLEIVKAANHILVARLALQAYKQKNPPNEEVQTPPTRH